MLSNTIIDTHCHLDFDCFDADRDQVIIRARKKQVSDIIIPGTQQKYWRRIGQLCQRPHLYPCYGLHPYWINSHTEDDISALKIIIRDKKCVAIGECGLDFRDGQANREQQQFYFSAQLEIANDAQLPVVIHSVHATEAIIKNLKKFPNLIGMVHSYSGSLEQAKQLIDKGFYISIGGSVTYAGAKKIRRVARHIPLTALLLETDSPDQADSTHRGKRNEPAYLVNVLTQIALLRNESAQKIAGQTSLNTKKLFHLDTYTLL